jgi:predicted small lipoprotein YifL
MTKRIISLLMIAVLMVGMLAACGKDGPLTAEDAKKVVLNDLGVKERNVDSIDVHMTPIGDSMGYIVYVSMGEEHLQYVVDGITGEILHKEETDEGHHH